MKLTLQIKLLPTADQRATLLDTMKAFNAAASHAAKVGFEANVFSQPPIHTRCYYEIRERFGLSAQMAVRAIGKAVEVFRRDKKRCPVFRPDGAVTYDQRIMSWKGVDKVSLWTLAGRQVIAMVYGQYQAKRFDRMKGQVDLVYRDGEFCLFATVDIPEDAPVKVHEFLGIDLGVTNIAVDSDGEIHPASTVKSVRHRHRRLRRKLQKKGTRSAKRRLKKLSGKERRFAKDVNHCISKQIVAKAQRTERGIAVEDLKHIRTRVTARRSQRAILHSWAFAQLRSFIEYKAGLFGIPVVAVDPRNTSRECPACGCIDKKNRPNQSTFSCVSCGYAGIADVIAAGNISRRAAVNPPYVAAA